MKTNGTVSSYKNGWSRFNKVATAVLMLLTIINLLGGWYGANFFLKNIQPYAEAQNKNIVEIEKLKAWRDAHNCVTDEMKDAIRERPNRSEIAPEFRRLNDNIETIKIVQTEIKQTLSQIHQWIMDDKKKR